MEISSGKGSLPEDITWRVGPLLPIGDDGPEESESESCRMSLSFSSESLRLGDSGSRMIGWPLLSIDFVRLMSGGRNRFVSGKGGVDSFSMSWIVSKGLVG